LTLSDEQDPICLSLSRVVAGVPTFYEEIYPRANKAIVGIFLKAVWGTRDLQMLKVFLFKPVSFQNRPLLTNKAYKYVIKESVSFFQIAWFFVSFITDAVKVSILKIAIQNLLHFCTVWG
jgi:hypothetical protein